MSLSTLSPLSSAPSHMDVMPVPTRDAVLALLKTHAASSDQITAALKTDPSDAKEALQALFAYENIEYKRNVNGERIYYIGRSEAKSVGDWNASDFKLRSGEKPYRIKE